MKLPCFPRPGLSPKLLAVSLAATVALGFAGVAAAQDEPKVAVVDVARIFREYYRTREIEGKLNEARNLYQTQLDERVENHHRVIEEIARIDKALGNPGLDDRARIDRQKERAKAVEQIQKLEQEAKEFKVAHERGIQEMTVRGRTQIVENIMVIINARVETKHYDLILNRSARGVGARAAVLYANDNLDITGDILAALNEGHPMPKLPESAAFPDKLFLE